MYGIFFILFWIKELIFSVYILSQNLPPNRLNFICNLQDRPLHEDHLDLWMLLIAIGIGLLLLLVVVLICWRCGFFKRRRPADMLLHKAHYQFHALDQFSESS